MEWWRWIIVALQIAWRIGLPLAAGTSGSLGAIKGIFSSVGTSP